MKIPVLPDLRLHPGALPIDEAPEGARGAVLYVHGFTGYPGEARPLADRLLRAGWAFCAPRLPGHGSNRADFLSTTRRDWLRRSVDALLELRSRFPLVHVCGHSMGGLLATMAAARVPVDGLVLLAPGFLLPERIKVAPFLAPFVPFVRRGLPVPAWDAEEPRRTYHAEYRSDDMVRPAAELLRLSREALRELPAIRCRILAVGAENDRSVPARVVDLVRERATGAASVETEVMEGVGHLFHFVDDPDRAAARVLRFLAGGREA
ncbi:MAG: alpha/beta fold hydrolase [Spirochaetales bacterium]|nr:alpha/beta fold hydrolase [Spirochaetales bacterium]